MAEFKLTFEDGSDGYLAQAELDPKEVERRRYAFPEERKFPLTDASKVMSAVKFFNYVDPKNERHLANAILKRMEELGISEVNVGPNNRFKKYYEAQDGYLKHFGVKGMHWGVWNEETRARRIGGSGSKRNKPTADSKIFEKAYNERVRKTSNAISKDPEIRKSLNKVTSYEKRYGLNFEDPEFSWTSKSQAVRKGYSKVHNTYTDLQKQKHKEYTKKYKDEVYSKYIQKYGKTTFKKSKRKYQREGAAAIAKLSAIVLTAPISVPIIVAKGMHESKKNEHSEKQ